MVTPIQRLRQLAVQLLAGIDLLLLTGLLLIVCWQVISRYVLAAPSTISEELAQILLMCLGPLGAAYTCAYREHMAIELLAPRLSPGRRRALARGIDLLCAFFALVLMRGGYGIVTSALALNQKSAVLQLPIGLIYLAVPVGGGFMLLFLAADFLAPAADAAPADVLLAEEEALGGG